MRLKTKKVLLSCGCSCCNMILSQNITKRKRLRLLVSPAVFFISMEMFNWHRQFLRKGAIGWSEMALIEKEKGSRNEGYGLWMLSSRWKRM